MSDKKRRTITTIETREIWIVRKAKLGVSDETESLVPTEIPKTAAVSPLSELNDSSETIEDES